MWDAKIITLFKNKGERSDCNNYRGISLLSVIGKVFAKIILIRLQKLAERVHSESQCGFRAGRSTIGMVFSLRQLQEKCREQQMPCISLSLTSQRRLILSAETVSSRSFQRLAAHQIAEHDRILPHKHERDSVVQRQLLKARSGVKQGFVLSQTLFGIFFALLLRHTFGTASEGICLRTRSDGRISILATSEPRQRFVKPSSETCCLWTMRQ